MKLTIGWWKARNGSKWNVVWVKGEKALAHNELGDDAWCFFSDGRWSKHGAYEIDLIAPWAKPSVRPWKTEEVPPGIWVRNKSIPKVKMWVTAIGPDCVCVVGSTGETFRITFELLCNAYEYFVGGVIAWKPCGVEVPNE